MAHVPTKYGTLPCVACDGRNTKSVKVGNVREWRCDDCGEVFDTRRWFATRKRLADRLREYGAML